MEDEQKERYFVKSLEEVPVWSLSTAVERFEDGDVTKLRCYGCGHEWNNRVPEPKVCPDCHANLLWGETPDGMYSLAEVEVGPGDDSDEEQGGQPTMDEILNRHD